jgi:hypothetical protein
LAKACPAENKTSPKTLDGAMTSGLYIYVDDVDAHCEHARAAGATIVKEPEDQFYGDRNYTAQDPGRPSLGLRPTHPRYDRRGMLGGHGASSGQLMVGARLHLVGELFRLRQQLVCPAAG